MTRTPLVFLGTPEPAAVILDEIVKAGHDVVHVITGPDKRRGRGSTTSPTAVKVVAMESGIGVSHDLGWFDGRVPRNTRGIVVAYGRIIPVPILEMVPMWNVHFSLLPRWRGAAPVARAILAGDTVTGACIMELEEGLDTGAVLGCTETPITRDDTTESLTQRLALLGAAKLLDVLDDPAPVAVAQQGAATYARKVEPEEGRIDWHDSSEHIRRRVRALRAFSTVEGRRLRVLSLGECDVHHGLDVTPGTVHTDGCVTTGDGSVQLVTVQEEGRPACSAADWLRGWRGISRVLGSH